MEVYCITIPKAPGQSNWFYSTYRFHLHLPSFFASFQTPRVAEFVILHSGFKRITEQLGGAGETYKKMDVEIMVNHWIFFP